jgi:hypothetical protein
MLEGCFLPLSLFSELGPCLEKHPAIRLALRESDIVGEERGGVR